VLTADVDATRAADVDVSNGAQPEVVVLLGSFCVRATGVRVVGIVGVNIVAFAAIVFALALEVFVIGGDFADRFVTLGFFLFVVS
jgi:hypothetical protein